MIGILGDLEFVASSNKIHTFQEMSTTQSVRYAEHASLQRKPVLEYIGPNLDEVSLKIQWRIEDKVNPLAEIDKLKKKMDDGEFLPFFLGSRKVGTGKFVITDIPQTYNRVDNHGNVLSVSAEVKLKEVVEKKANVERKVTKQPSKKAKQEKITVAKNKALLKSFAVSPVLGAGLTALDKSLQMTKGLFKK